MNITALLDKIAGASHNRRTFYGKVSQADQLLFIGINLGASMLRISEEDQTILILKKCQHGSFELKDGKYKSIARINIAKPMLSTFDTAPKAVRSEIISFMNASKRGAQTNLPAHH